MGYNAAFDVRDRYSMNVRPRRTGAVATRDTLGPPSGTRRGVGAPLDLDAGVCERVRLITALSRLVGEQDVPDAMRTAGLALIGYLARRFPGEAAHHVGVPDSSKCATADRVRRRRG